MKNKPTPPAPVSLALSQPSGCCTSPLSAWTAFWFTPASLVSLHALRILAGLLFLACVLPLAGHVDALYSLQGWHDREAHIEGSRMPGGSPVFIGWSVFYLCGPGNVQTVYWTAIAVMVLFTLGLFPRITGMLTWVFVVSFLANPATRLEVDYMLIIPAFYLMVAYVLLGQFSGGLSIAERILGSKDTFVLAPLFGWKSSQESSGSIAANLTGRLFQVHFALIVVTSAMHKLQQGDWWSGVALWQPLHEPFATTLDQLRAEARYFEFVLFAISLVQYFAVAWQLTFPLWAWRQSMRPMLLVGGALGFLACAFMWKTPLFGAFYFLGCLSYLTPAEWLWVRNTLATGWHIVAGKNAVQKDSKSPVPVRV